MKAIRRIVFLIGIISLLAGKEAYAESSLQSLIDSAPAGGTLQLENRIYHERVVLDKPIHLIGEKGTVFKVCTSNPVMTIKGEKVRIQGVKIEGCKTKSNKPVIFITGKNHQLKDVTVNSRAVAVKLDQTANSEFINMKITGYEEERGFDLWESHFNTFKGIKIDHAQDGFYMENSHYNIFIGNNISHSRYGLHVMFSDNITIKKNHSFQNFTGAMVMATNNTIIQDNKLNENNQNVNAQGLLLYDVHSSEVSGNLISDNRVGMYMEDSSENVIKNNQINANFIGAQINKISNNKIINNSFISNVSEVQAIKGNHNLIKNNYWDAASKLDTNGDGTSNLPYRADPFFLNLIDETPEYQLFFQDPGMLLLQKMLKSPENMLVTDDSPLMMAGGHKNGLQKTNNDYVWILSIIMITGSLLMIIKGRKRL